MYRKIILISSHEHGGVHGLIPTIIREFRFSQNFQILPYILYQLNIYFLIE